MHSQTIDRTQFIASIRSKFNRSKHYTAHLPDKEVFQRYFEGQDFKDAVVEFFNLSDEDLLSLYFLNYPVRGQLFFEEEMVAKVVQDLPEFFLSVLRIGISKLITLSGFQRENISEPIFFHESKLAEISEAIFNGWKQIGVIEASKVSEDEKLLKLADIPATLEINHYYYDLLGCLQLNYNSQVVYIESRGARLKDKSTFLIPPDKSKRDLLTHVTGYLAMPIAFAEEIPATETDLLRIWKRLDEKLKEANFLGGMFPLLSPHHPGDYLMDGHESVLYIEEEVVHPYPPGTIQDYDTLALDLSENPVQYDKFHFRLEQSRGNTKPTNWISLSITDSTFFYFLALNRLENPEDDCQSIHPEKAVDRLDRIHNKFINFLKGPVKKELCGERNKGTNSWVFGSGNTKTKYAQRIHQAFEAATGINKSNGSLLQTCQNNIEGGGFHLAPHITNIIHKIPPE